MRLMQRGDEFSIMLGTNELMNSRVGGSEEALATLALQRLPATAKRRVLIGGLGMGFTLRATLAALVDGGTISVAEISPEVVRWARGPLAPVFGDSLDDPRVEIVEGDVRHVIGQRRGAFDAILLDVDNGPDGLTVSSNDALYSPAGLTAARLALSPGGVLAVWSSGPSPQFTRRLHRAGFAAE